MYCKSNLCIIRGSCEERDDYFLDCVWDYSFRSVLLNFFELMQKVFSAAWNLALQTPYLLFFGTCALLALAVMPDLMQARRLAQPVAHIVLIQGHLHITFVASLTLSCVAALRYFPLTQTCSTFATLWICTCQLPLSLILLAVTAALRMVPHMTNRVFGGWKSHMAYSCVSLLMLAMMSDWKEVVAESCDSLQLPSARIMLLFAFLAAFVQIVLLLLRLGALILAAMDAEHGLAKAWEKLFLGVDPAVATYEAFKEDLARGAVGVGQVRQAAAPS